MSLRGVLCSFLYIGINEYWTGNPLVSDFTSCSDLTSLFQFYFTLPYMSFIFNLTERVLFCLVIALSVCLFHDIDLLFFEAWHFNFHGCLDVIVGLYVAIAIIVLWLPNYDRKLLWCNISYLEHCCRIYRNKILVYICKIINAW